jgi:hypothetical protein
VTRIGLALALCLTLGAGGCLVQSQCAADYDCASGERCNLSQGSESYGSCYVECRTDQDCYLNGVYFGKHCVQSRCEFRFDERVQAPGFCMKVVNPKSTAFEKEWCLSGAKGKVTILYFAWLT